MITRARQRSACARAAKSGKRGGLPKVSPRRRKAYQ
jgi:DNA invertase Pin-like site-specific DNA recombinase